MSKPTDHNDRDHAKYAPSAAHRWLVCPGSVELSKNIQERSSSYAQEGTECHEAANDILTGIKTFDEATASLTEDQTWIVEEYTNFAFDTIDRLNDKFDKVKVWVEENISSPEISKDFGGTSDLSILAGRTLGVIDLKAGFNPVQVRLENGVINPQLGSYGVLVMDHHKLWDKVDKIRLTIVQPRVYDKPQTETINVDELYQFKIALKRGIREIENGVDDLRAGEHCKYCPARGRCPMLRDEAVKKAKIVFDEPREARSYSAEELAGILNEAEMIQAHIDGVRAHVMRELEKGRKVPGYKLVPKRASYKWTDFDAALFAISKLGVDGHNLFAHKPKTPLQIQKLLKDEKIEFGLSSYFVKESSGPTLARAEDPRDEWKADPFKEGS